MTPVRGRRALRAAALGALLAAAVGGCGQRGPLVLPGTQPAEQPQPLPPGEPESQDDERENER
jgi:predicted small lipoprotein YifL